MPERPVAVFDLDGTLADTRRRLPFLRQRPIDWNAFFAAAPDDPPLTEGIALVLAHAETSDIVYVTGRPARRRPDTEMWLARHSLPAGTLLMRADGDRRPARISKLELLARLATKRAVSVVVDDDEQVCVAYEKAGFTVIRATWLTASEPLERAQEERGRT